MRYMVSRKSLVKEKFEYLRHILAKWADIFSTHKKSVHRSYSQQKHCQKWFGSIHN